jgi:hypothetical protein
VDGGSSWRRVRRAAAWYAETIVARPEKHIPASLEEAVAQLKRDPQRPVHARVDDLDVEIRVVADETTVPADVFAGVGPWQGETTEELLRVLREARQHDDEDAHWP